MTFNELLLSAPVLKALDSKGYSSPTPIQQKAIPVILNKKDVFGCAQTGTGKTAAFALPIIELMSRQKNKPGVIKTLVLAPTRELALQISENFADYSQYLPIKHTVIFGGVSQVNQVNILRKGVDVLIATPGRLIDLVQQKLLRLDQVEYFVLDEADRMLDMGFIHDIKKIIKLIPTQRQTLFFSATVSPDIMKLARSLLKNPEQVSADVVSSASSLVHQSVYMVKKENKRMLLKHLIQEKNIEHALVFTRTKHGADKVVKDLNKTGIKAEAIHGNKSQNARVKALNGFKNKSIRILVATDIASRGIDVEKLSHVINFEIPEVAETYVHRIGRTGRSGSEGIAFSFCDETEMPYLNGIQKLIKNNIAVADHPYAN